MIYGYARTALGRAGLRRALVSLGKRDVLMVTRLDRLVRSTRDLLNTIASIADRQTLSSRLVVQQDFIDAVRAV